MFQKVKSGDLDSLGQLIQKYYGDVYAYCYRRLGRKDDAEDITQEVFLHFCRNFNSFVQKGKCRNYLFVIARNLCINEKKKKSPVPLDDIEETGDSGKNSLAEHMEAADYIQKALRLLPKEQKEVILLRYYHGFKLKDIAQIMNSGLSVTKYRLYRGLKTLSNLLSKEDWL